MDDEANRKKKKFARTRRACVYASGAPDAVEINEQGLVRSGPVRAVNSRDCDPHSSRK